jgi:hypothetical protein
LLYRGEKGGVKKKVKGRAEWIVKKGGEYCRACRAAAKATDCDSCEGRIPELDPEDEALFHLYDDFCRWGFSGDLFKANGLTINKDVMAKIRIIDEVIEEWQKSGSE